MSIEIVTGYQGKNHVTANDIGGFQQGVVGVEDYVLGVGEKAKATLISNNTIRISDGELVMQGVHWRIKPGTYENVTINNGSQGMKRKDAIIARYRKESGMGIESIELAVLQGNPTYSTPTAPTPTTGNIRSGALKHEMILYVVELNGLNVVGVEPAFQVLMSMYEINKYLSDISDCVVESGGNIVNGFRKWKSGRMEQWLNTPKTIPINTKWGGLYISEQQSGLLYNEPFVSPPAVIMDVKGETKDGCWIMKCNSGDSSKTPNFFFVRGDALSTPSRMNVFAYAVGSWK